MGSYRLLMLAVLCLTGNVAKGGADNDPTSNDSEGNLKDTGTGIIGAAKHEGSDRKLKRDLPIVGPIPSSYRGQATGETTFDGIQAGDLQLPRVDASGFGRDQQARPVQGFRSEQQLFRSSIPSRFGGFSSESSSDVYNFDGKEPVTYDGILASDLMVPLPHVSRVSTNRSPVPSAAPGNNQQYQQMPLHRQQVPRQVDSTVDDIFPGDLTLPTLSTTRQVFSRPDVFKSFGDTEPQLRDGALFLAETPAERYSRLQEQYQATLEEYRISLARFRQQLQKYATISRHKK